MSELLLETLSIPKNWKYVKIEEISNVIRGASPRPKGDPKYFGGNIPWIMIRDISKEKGKYITKTKDTVTEEGAKKSLFLKKGSLILSNSGTVCVPKILGVDGCIHDGFVTFPNIEKNMNILFVYYWFEKIRSKIREENKQGVTQINLNTTIVRNIEIPLPPLNEQKRITEKIEELFSLLDSSKETLDHLRVLLTHYRQSLLKQIFNRKTSEYNLKKASLKELFTNRHGDFLPKNKLKTGSIPVFGGNGITGYHNESNVNGNMLIVGRVGAHCGNVHLFSGKSWITDNAIGLISKIKINPKFFFFQLQHLKLNDLRSGTGQPYVTGKILSELDIFTTDIDEQTRIVTRIEEYFSTIQNIGKLIDSLLLHNRSIKNSILKQAFEGKLVPQDPNDEPAEILLQKIKQEKEQLIQKQKPSRKKKNVK